MVFARQPGKRHAEQRLTASGSGGAIHESLSLVSFKMYINSAFSSESDENRLFPRPSLSKKTCSETELLDFPQFPNSSQKKNVLDSKKLLRHLPRFMNHTIASSESPVELSSHRIRFGKSAF